MAPIIESFLLGDSVLGGTTDADAQRAVSLLDGDFPLGPVEASSREASAQTVKFAGKTGADR
jgi:hypothetical protein